MSNTTVVFDAAADPLAGLSDELREAFGRVTELASLPEVTTRIVEAVEDPQATAHDMHKIIRNDPALAAKILKVVNSAFYGLPSQIANLDRAILLLGLSAVKNIALAASLSRLFRAEAISDQFAARDLWRHCVAVGVCARLLGKAARWSQADEAFVAGLMHDLGLITAQQIFPERTREVAERCFNAATDFCAVERELLGADHQVFGNALTSRWKFPPGLRAAVASHHAPFDVPLEYQRLTCTVYVADVLASQGRFGFWLTAQTHEITTRHLASIELDQACLDAVAEQLPDAVCEAEKVFAE